MTSRVHQLRTFNIILNPLENKQQHRSFGQTLKPGNLQTLSQAIAPTLHSRRFSGGRHVTGSILQLIGLVLAICYVCSMTRKLGWIEFWVPRRFGNGLGRRKTLA